MALAVRDGRRANSHSPAGGNSGSLRAFGALAPPGMQVVGSNVGTMQENCRLYEIQKQEYLKELEVAQARINELKPEAYVGPEMRPEYDELKDEIHRLGGVERVREVLATEEATSRRPFLQAKR